MSAATHDESPEPELCPECGFAFYPATGKHVDQASTTLDCERMYPKAAAR